MAIERDSEFFNFASTSKQNLTLARNAQNYKSRKPVPFYKTKNVAFTRKYHISSRKLRKLRRANFVNPFSMPNSEINGVTENVCFKSKLPDYTNSDFSIEQNMLSATDFVSNSPNELTSPRYNSPIDHCSTHSSKSQSSIEDLNKEIERLFLNNDKYGFSSFVWDNEETAEGRRAPIADMLTCYKSHNCRKKRRSATALGIRNNESDSSNGMSSPDDNSGCEEYCDSKFAHIVNTPIVVPVPVGKSSINDIDVDFNKPFINSKLHLSEDSAFAPIKCIQRSQSTPPQNAVDMGEESDHEIF